jgi:Response regulator of the LytR/AlgR family
LARERMRVYLEPYSDMRIVGECDSGQQASRELVRLRPDLVFLDVQLADMSGFDVLASLQPEQRPLVVFLTAHEEYAVRAFEVSAVDYLVKPVIGLALRNQ